MNKSSSGAEGSAAKQILPQNSLGEPTIVYQRCNLREWSGSQASTREPTRDSQPQEPNEPNAATTFTRPQPPRAATSTSVKGGP